MLCVQLELGLPDGAEVGGVEESEHYTSSSGVTTIKILERSVSRCGDSRDSGPTFESFLQAGKYSGRYLFQVCLPCQVICKHDISKDRTSDLAFPSWLLQEATACTAKQH